MWKLPPGYRISRSLRRPLRESIKPLVVVAWTTSRSTTAHQLWRGISFANWQCLSVRILRPALSRKEFCDELLLTFENVPAYESGNVASELKKLAWA